MRKKESKRKEGKKARKKGKHESWKYKKCKRTMEGRRRGRGGGRKEGMQWSTREIERKKELNRDRKKGKERRIERRETYIYAGVPGAIFSPFSSDNFLHLFWGAGRGQYE